MMKGTKVSSSHQLLIVPDHTLSEILVPDLQSKTDVSGLFQEAPEDEKSPCSGQEASGTHTH